MRGAFVLGLSAATILVAFACSSSDTTSVPGTDAGADGGAPQAVDGGGIDTGAPESGTDAATDGGADADADAAPVVLKQIGGHVDLNGPLAGATVTLLAPAADSTTTDANGDFTFHVPLGSTAIMKVDPPAAANALPMIRGIVVGDTNRIRVFYVASQSDKDAAEAIGHTFDPAKAIVEVDFRDSTIGGYGATMQSGGAAVTPGFGLVYDAMGNPQSSMTTVTGGDGSTLLLGDVPTASSVSFSATVPAAATLPCQACDAPSLPLQAGVVTWFDYECGTATDCH